MAYNITKVSGVDISGLTSINGVAIASISKLQGVEISASEVITTGLVINLDASNSSSYGGTGTLWNDLSSSNNDATLVNGVTYNSTEPKSLVLDGTNDYIRIPYNSSFGYSNTMEGITASIWFKFNTLPTQNLTNFFAKDYITGDIEIYVDYWTVTNSWRAGVYSPSTGTNPGTSYTMPLTNDYWYNLTFSVSRITNTTGSLKFYMNGEMLGSASFTIGNGNTWDDLETGSDLLLGGDPILGRHGDMEIAKFVFYDQVLTDSEVMQNYDTLRERFGQPEPTTGMTDGLLYEYTPFTIGTSSPYDWTPTSRGLYTTGTIDNVAMSRVTYDGVTALYADGTDSYLRGFPITTAWEGRDEWSYSFWINVGTGGNAGTYNAKIFSVDVDDGGSGANYDFRVVRVNTPHQIQIAAKFDDSTQIYLTDSSGDVVGNSGWYNITHTHKTGGYSLMYIDGTLKASWQVPSTAKFANTSSNFNISGARMWNYYNATWADGQGRIGYIGFWDKELSSTEVGQVYNYGVNTLGF